MAVAHAAAGTAEPGVVPSLSLTTSFDGESPREHGLGYYNSTSSPSSRRISLPVLHSPRLAQSEHSFVGDQDQLSPPTFPLIASASTTDLQDTSTNPILSPLQRRATVRQTRSSANMRFSMSASSSPAPSPVGTGPAGTRKRSDSRSSSPAMTIERKPVPLAQFGSLGRKNKLRPSSLAQSPTVPPGEGFPRLGTPTNSISRSPNLPFSANSTPALTQTPSWASLPQPPPPPQAPFLERSKTPPAVLFEKVKTGFGSPSRKKNAPDRITTSFGEMGSKDSGDEALGMISFFSPISSDEEDERVPMRLPKPRRVWTGEGLVGMSGAPRPGSKKSTILFSELTGGVGKDPVEGGKKEKKEKKEGGRRRVSGFGAGSFRKFWGGKDEEPKSPGIPKSPGFQVVSVPADALPPPNPSFLNKAAQRASSPSPFRRKEKKDKEEKKEKKDKKDKESKKGNKEKEVTIPKGINMTPNSTFSGRVKISSPIPHPGLLQIFPSPTSPKFPPGARPRGASLSLLPTALPHPPGIHHSYSAASSTYSRRLSSDLHAPSMTSFTSSSTGGNKRSSPLSPGGSNTSRPEDQASSSATALNLNQYSGASMALPPSPPYTGGDHHLRPHTGHVRSVSAPSINFNLPRNSSYQYNPYGTTNTAACLAPVGAGWKFPAPVQPQQQYKSREEAQSYSPGSAQDLLHTLHQSLAISEKTYSHSMSNIAKEISLDERLAQELEAVEKRLRSQMEIVAGIRRQVEERKKRRESKLRREREADIMAVVKETQSESERSFFSSGSSEEDEEADDEHEVDEAEEGNVSQVTTVAQDGFIGRRPLTNVDEEVGELPDTTLLKSSFTNNPHIPSATEGLHSLHHASSIPRLSAIKRTDTDMTITSATSISPTASTATTPTHSAPPSKNNISLLPKRTSISAPRRRPVGSLARQTFGEEQRKHAVLELRTNIAPTPEGSRAPTPASAIPRYTPIQTQAPPVVGLGIVSPSYIPAPTPAGLQSSASSFSFESSDVERAATQGYHHLPLSAAPSQQPSRETLNDTHDDVEESREKDDKVMDEFRQRFEDKKGMYYNHQSASTTSISLNLHPTTTNSSTITVPQVILANAYQPPQIEKPTSGHIHFPTPSSNANSRSNSRANTPIPFGPSGNGLMSPPISPPTSSHGGRHYRAGGGIMEEVVRERAMSPEGMLMRSVTFGEGLPAVVGGTSGHERKAVIEGVELMLI